MGGGTDSVYASVNYALTTGSEVEFLYANAGASSLVLTGNEFANNIIGATGYDSLTGAAGNDTLTGGLGADTMAGGTGNDTYYVDNAGDVVTEAVGSGTDSVYTSVNYALSAASEVEFLYANAGATGLALTGNEFANNIVGAAGNDTLTGGLGPDTMAGGTGNDSYYVDNAGDVVTEAMGGGTDTVYISVNYALSTGTEVEFLYANAGATGLALTGNELANNIAGGAGNDLLSGAAGNDTLTGGLGADNLAGGVGNDSYYVDNAGDIVTEAAGEGIDSVYASVNYGLATGSEVEFLYASAGTTGLALTGNAIANNIVGAGGNDTLTGGLGADTMTGGTGNDAYYVDNAGDVVNEAVGGGSDSVYTSINYVLSAASEVEFLYANAGAAGLALTGNAMANNIVGAAGNDSLSGAAGNDTLTGGFGADTMAGGTGNDSYYVDNAVDVITEATGEGTDSVYASVNYSLATGSEVEFLYANAGATGLALTGNAMANDIVGAAGNDTLTGGLGADTMAGGTGDDNYYVDNAGDLASEATGEGVDRVYASVNYALSTGSEIEFLYANAGVTGLTLTGNELANTILGVNGADSLVGGGGNDTLNGGLGADTMAGGLGADTMAGGTGDDNYYVDNAGDLASEATGEGVDRVYASVNYALSAGSEVEFLYANAGATGLTLIGNELANTILGVNGADSLVGGGGNDTLNGGLGADTMAGGTGDDTYYVDNAGDIAIEAVGEGIDRVYTTTSYALIAGSEIEFLCTTGAASSLTLTGNGFANNLTGSSGNDTLDGGAGADTLAGGLGADLFSFHIAQAGGDSIADFVPASDKLRFVGYSQGSTFLQVGTSNAWQLTDAMTHATENITFANSAHPGALDYAFV